MTRTALITGATGGIGSAVAKRLRAKGLRLMLVDFDAAKLETMAKDFPGASTPVLDQRDRGHLDAFCGGVIETGAFIDICVINAGMLVIGDLADISRQDTADQIQVNLTATAMLVQSFARRMGREGRGHILATVSMGGIVSLNGSATYSAAKFGMRGLHRRWPGRAGRGLRGGGAGPPRDRAGSGAAPKPWRTGALVAGRPVHGGHARTTPLAYPRQSGPRPAGLARRDWSGGTGPAGLARLGGL